MNKISWKHVLLGGLLGGLLWFSIAALRAGVIDPEGALLEIGLPFDPDTGFMVVAVVVSLFFGLMAAWLYASIRPRYGPGPATAVRAGLALGLILAFADWAWATVLQMPLGFTIWSIVTEPVVAVAVTVAVAATYKEPEPSG